MRLYTGSYSQVDFTLSQPDELGPIVSKWEDGLRTTGKRGELEWWYFDTKFDDGALFVCYFWKVSKWEDGLRTTGKRGELEWWYFDTKFDDGALFVCYFWKVHPLKDIYFIGMNYNTPDGKDLFLMKFFNEKDVSFANDSCDVVMGNNYFKGNLNKYNIFLSADDFEGFGIEIKLNSTLKPYRPQDGIIRAGSDYFAWLAAVPNGTVEAKIVQNGKEFTKSGNGYHDHNWGNTPLQKLFDSWSWFRGTSGDYTVIAADLNTSAKRGGYKIPILYMANEEELLVIIQL